jgi:4-hydroxy-2-oxoheptanedioate aldolase
MRKSRALEKMRRGECAFSCNISMAPSPELVEMAGLAGFDACWIDMEHRDYTYREVNHMIRAARVVDMDALVRIRREGYFSYFRPLEAGAAGIMVPHCLSGEDARIAARNSRYHPIGLRGLETVGPDADYANAPAREYMSWANRETFVAVQIEDREAVEDLDAIASTPGIDMLFLGPADLTQSYGIPLEFTHPLIREAAEKIAAAAERHGIFWGTTCAGPEAARPYIEMGARFVNVVSDFGLLHAGLHRVHDECEALLRSLKPGARESGAASGAEEPRA